MDINVLHNISYGMYIVSSHKDKSFNAQIVNTAFQVTSTPVTIAISVSKLNLTHEFIETSSSFALSILSEDTPLTSIGKFGFKSGRQEDKFKGIKFKVLDSGCPVVLDNAIGYIEAKVIKKLDCSTHTLFLGEVISSAILKTGRPLTYDYYHQVKRGTTPETAPTYIREEALGREPAKMQRYRCNVCNYIYDPAMGDPDAGISPNTPFENLPGDWVCPVCGEGKSEFTPEKVC